MKLLEKIMKNDNVRITALIAVFYILTNIPAFVSTYTASKDEIKPTLSEQIKFEMASLKDISDGAVYSNFRLLGSSAGYLTRKLIK